MAVLVSNIQKEAIKVLEEINKDSGYKGSDMKTACYVAESIGAYSKSVEHLITRKVYQQKLRDILPGIQLKTSIMWDGLITVLYENGTLYKNGQWISTYGSGITFEEACEDYYNQIYNKKIKIGDKEMEFIY